MYAEVNKESFIMIPRVIKTAMRHRAMGIPKIEGANLKELATTVIKENAGDVFIAGKSHFRYMWITDLGIAINGAKSVLAASYLMGQLQRVIDDSSRLGYVPTCFSKNHGFNMPFKRQDNFPCLIHSLYSLRNCDKKENYSDNEHPDMYNGEKIKQLYAQYLNDYFDKETHLLRNDATHDWMDTVKRPSSTFSNLLLLNMFKQYGEMFGGKTYYKECEKALLDSRWMDNYFIDYDNCGKYLCADANVPVLYFDLFSDSIKRKIYDTMESSELLDVCPMKTRQGLYKGGFLSMKWANDYHSVIWPHLGLMYMNGLKTLGKPYESHLEKMESILWKYKNFLEVIDMESKPYLVPLFTTDYGFSMAAGQYLELMN
jgi:hypothetical protein